MKIDKISCLCLDKRYFGKTPSYYLQNDVFYCLNLMLEKFICGDGSYPLKYDHVDIMKPPAAPFRYGTPGTINRHYNAFLCHKKMVQRAIDEDRENILLLEDDAYFTSRFSEIWNQIHDKLDTIEFDVVYLGWWMERPNSPDENGDRADLESLWAAEKKCGVDKVPRKPFIKQEICGLHGLLVNKSAFSLLANAPWGPMDSFLTTQLDRLKAYYVWPKIIHVGSGFSNCENTNVIRNKI